MLGSCGSCLKSVLDYAAPQKRGHIFQRIGAAPSAVFSQTDEDAGRFGLKQIEVYPRAAIPRAIRSARAMQVSIGLTAGLPVKIPVSEM